VSIYTLSTGWMAGLYLDTCTTECFIGLLLGCVGPFVLESCGRDEQTQEFIEQCKIMLSA
jgi:hypothetical protein